MAEKAAQHFDALRHIKVEGGGLSLAVRHAGRDAVGDQLHAAHAEGGAGAEAARGNLQILRVVLAVGCHQSRHGGQRLAGVDARLGLGDAGGVDNIDRRRHIKNGVADAGGADDYRVLRRDSFLGGDGARGCKQAAIAFRRNKCFMVSPCWLVLYQQSKQYTCHPVFVLARRLHFTSYLLKEVTP
jgi:hypothetical protein